MESRRRTGLLRRAVLTGAVTVLAGIGTSMLLPLAANAATSDPPPPPRRPTVSTLYRGDSRPPSEIFRNGFSGRGNDGDLARHVHGGEGARNSAYISTSEDGAESSMFTRSQGLTNSLDQLEHLAMACRGEAPRRVPWGPVRTYFVERSRPGCAADAQGRLPLRSYIYEIDPRVAGNAYAISDLIRTHPELGVFAGQREWAYRGHIPTEAIIRVQIYEARVPITYNAAGNPNFGNFRNQPGEWRRVPEQAGQQSQQNPFYRPAQQGPSRIVYPNVTNGTNSRPGTSGSANPRDHVGSSSHDELRRRRLNKTTTESGAANPYTRGCSTITRCRRGSSGPPAQSAQPTANRPQQANPYSRGCSAITRCRS